MVEFIKMAEIQFTILAPLTNAQASRLTLDKISVIEKTVEQLPKENQRHQNKVDEGQYHDSVLQV